MRDGCKPCGQCGHTVRSYTEGADGFRLRCVKCAARMPEDDDPWVVAKTERIRIIRRIRFVGNWAEFWFNGDDEERFHDCCKRYMLTEMFERRPEMGIVIVNHGYVGLEILFKKDTKAEYDGGNWWPAEAKGHAHANELMRWEKALGRGPSEV